MLRFLTCLGVLALVLALVMVLVIGAGCAGKTPPGESETVTLAKTEVELARYRALEKQYEVEAIDKEADAHVRKVTAETSNRIVEMHEIVVADMERLTVMQNAFVDAVNNHQAALMNQSFLLQQQYEQMQNMEHNIHAAAENSWFSNILMVLLCVVVLGLICLTAGLGIRFERKIYDLVKRFDQHATDEGAGVPNAQ